MVQPRYPDGMKVRIRIKNAEGQVLYRDLERYENMTGVILNSKAIIAYFLPFVTVVERSQEDWPITLYMYTVKLEEGITLNDLIEYCLEEI